VSVDPLGDTVNCNACSHSHTYNVNLVGRVVRLTAHKSPVVTAVTVCCGCGGVTGDYTIVGAYPVCHKCAPVASVSVLDADKCVCGGVPVAWTTVLDKGQERAAGLCSQHACFAPDKVVKLADLVKVVDEHHNKTRARGPCR